MELQRLTRWHPLAQYEEKIRESRERCIQEDGAFRAPDVLWSALRPAEFWSCCAGMSLFFFSLLNGVRSMCRQRGLDVQSCVASSMRVLLQGAYFFLPSNILEI